jgi:hypothetical protein
VADQKPRIEEIVRTNTESTCWETDKRADLEGRKRKRWPFLRLDSYQTSPEFNTFLTSV